MKTKTPKTTVRVARLRKLADFLDELPSSHFAFGNERECVKPSAKNECGTVGCAMGWTPEVFPRLVKSLVSQSEPELWMPLALIRPGRRAEPMDWSRLADAIFDMRHGFSLFTPGMPSPATGKILGCDATPKQVARRIRTYATWCEKTGVRS